MGGVGGMQGTSRRRGHRLGSCFVHKAEHIGPQPLSTAKRKTDGGQTSTRARGQQDVRTEARRNSARALAPARAPRPGPQTGWARLLLLSLQFGARPPVTFPVTGDSPRPTTSSAGIGRTGCFIATRIGCQQLKARGEVDILGIVCQLRLDRWVLGCREDPEA